MRMTEFIELFKRELPDLCPIDTINNVARLEDVCMAIGCIIAINEELDFNYESFNGSILLTDELISIFSNKYGLEW